MKHSESASPSEPRPNRFKCATCKKVQPGIRTGLGLVALCECGGVLYNIEAEEAAEPRRDEREAGIPIIEDCPSCGFQHVDEGEWATRPHRTHQCQSCGQEWQPFPFPDYRSTWRRT